MGEKEQRGLGQFTKASLDLGERIVGILLWIVKLELEGGPVLQSWFGTECGWQYEVRNREGKGWRPDFGGFTVCENRFEANSESANLVFLTQLRSFPYVRNPPNVGLAERFSIVLESYCTFRESKAGVR